MSVENKKIVEKINASFAEGNTEGFLEFCADDVRWTMVGEKNMKGKEAIREWMKQMDGMEPPKLSATTVIAEGDSVAATCEMTMKGKDGQPESYQCCDIYRFQNGKITELNSFIIKTEAKGEGDNRAAA